jgi:ATP-dependent RNA helicase RhlE
VLFTELGLIEPLLEALRKEGYTEPTPVQERSVPVILKRRDLLSCAQTGTGKTAAFALPILQLLFEEFKPEDRTHKKVKALVLTPTRELAIQVTESFQTYGRYLPLRSISIYGGVSQREQVNALRQGVDVLIATPGRLLDLMQQRLISLADIRYFILDEADRMLDMGFINDVKKIVAKLPQKRQTLFFSATMPPEIQRLSSSILDNPEKVEVTPVSSTCELVQQNLYYVEKHNKRALLNHILSDATIETALVFARTKHGADKIAQHLNRSGIRAEAIHGNKSQGARQVALQNFKSRKTRVLVATDIAARGIDIDDMGLVINFELPNEPETYVHRIGRTGRAGLEGKAISFCDYEEKILLRDIQKLINRVIPVVKDHVYDMPLMHGSEKLETQTASSAMSKGPANVFRRKGRTFMQSRA